MARMYRRKGVDAMPTHIEKVFGVGVSKMQQLDVGVFRVDPVKETPLGVRLFSSQRPHCAVLDDLAVLQQLHLADGLPS